MQIHTSHFGLSAIDIFMKICHLITTSGQMSLARQTAIINMGMKESIGAEGYMGKHKPVATPVSANFLDVMKDPNWVDSWG